MAQMTKAEISRRVAEQVSSTRISSRLAELARFGGRSDGGVNRQAYSPDDRQARNYLARWADELGLTTFTDPIGNQFFRLTPAGKSLAAPAWTTGSHLDSQPTGGRFDGAAGIVAAFETITALQNCSIQLAHPVEIVSWANEEGSRFPPSCMGSMTYVGRIRVEDYQWLQDAQGNRLSDELYATLASTQRGRNRAFGTPMIGYLELHIEQGPILDQEGIPVGILEGIQGCRWFYITINGAARHAGTTPMHHRSDAVREAVAAISALHQALEDVTGLLKLTVGRIDTHPGKANTVAERVQFTIDIRHPDEEVLERAETAISSIVESSMVRCRADVARAVAHKPVHFDRGLQQRLAGAAADLRIPTTTMMSGAFHDAMNLTGFCPTAMIFVPSHGGISHHPDEFTRLADLTAGVRVLAATVAQCATATE